MHSFLTLCIRGGTAMVLALGIVACGGTDAPPAAPAAPVPGAVSQDAVAKYVGTWTRRCFRDHLENSQPAVDWTITETSPGKAASRKRISYCTGHPLLDGVDVQTPNEINATLTFVGTRVVDGTTVDEVLVSYELSQERQILARDPYGAPLLLVGSEYSSGGDGYPTRLSPFSFFRLDNDPLAR